MSKTTSPTTDSTDQSRKPEIVALSEVVRFHGHLCPGVAGCTTGRNTSIIRDHGKNVYTFINRTTNDAVRLSVRDREAAEDPVLKSPVSKPHARVLNGDFVCGPYLNGHPRGR